MLVCPKCSNQSSGDRRICRACGAILERLPVVAAVEHVVDSPPVPAPAKSRTPWAASAAFELC